jgi:hypothetical protein
MEQKRKFIKQFWSNARQSRIERRILVMDGVEDDSDAA